jgi:hypothetical protein
VQSASLRVSESRNLHSCSPKLLSNAIRGRHRILSEVSVSVSDPNPITKDTIRIQKVSYKKIKITIRIRKYPSDTIG